MLSVIENSSSERGKVNRLLILLVCNIFEQFSFRADILVGRHSDPDFEQSYHQQLNTFDVPEAVREFPEREEGLIKKSHDFLVNEKH